jgi:2-methylcitrate dehydratase PrpD
MGVRIAEAEVPMETTERLASFVAETRFETLSAEVVTAARRAILDTLGVVLAGAGEGGSRILLDAIGATSGAGAASIFGTSLRASPSQAALANGALGHALDFDDVNVNLRGHPSIPVLPAVLAMAEPRGSGGREALAAFVVGFEVECKLGRALGVSSYARGWHATSVVGAIGAAAACASLLGLDADRTRHALGIATSMACGTRQNFGTMTKPLHAGLAARAGVEAADLASRGFTAAPDILEAPMGFGVLFSPDGDWRPERLGDPGKPWDIVAPGINVKQYPCCYMTHQALDATLAATGRSPRDEAEVDSIEVRVAPGSTAALIHHRPRSGLEGKFSMEYCVAAAVLDGAVRLHTFDDAQVRRPAAQDLLRRVRVVHVPEAKAWSSPSTRVTVRMRDSSPLSAEVTRERGSPGDPLGWDELVAKYRDCAGRVLPEPQIARSLELISDFPESRVDELARTLTLEETGGSA